jgi:hypothetical protein
MPLRSHMTSYTYKKSYMYGGTPEPQTTQDAPWVHGPSLKIIYKYILRWGVPNLRAKAVAGLKPPFCKKIKPLLVGFNVQTRAQKMRKHLPHL